MIAEEKIAKERITEEMTTFIAYDGELFGQNRYILQ